MRDDKIRIIIKNKNHDPEINQEELKENLEKIKTENNLKMFDFTIMRDLRAVTILEAVRVRN